MNRENHHTDRSINLEWGGKKNSTALSKSKRPTAVTGTARVKWTPKTPSSHISSNSQRAIYLPSQFLPHHHVLQPPCCFTRVWTRLREINKLCWPKRTLPLCDNKSLTERRTCWIRRRNIGRQWGDGDSRVKFKAALLLSEPHLPLPTGKRRGGGWRRRGG